MTTTANRREFIRQGMIGAGALAAVGQFAPSSAVAIEPIARPGDAKFKFSLAAYSYRELLKGPSAKLTFEDFAADCAKMGLEGAELTSYYFPPDVDDDFLRSLKAHCFRLGLDVSGTAVGNDFCHPPGPEREKQIKSVKLWSERAAVLGAPVIRIFSGNARKGQDPKQAHRLAVEAIEECCEYAGKQGVFLALENHGGLTATADGMLQLVRDVKSKWFGVNLDSGNFHRGSADDIYADLAKIAPYALNVQVKVVIKPEGSPPQPTDFSRLAGICRDAGYRGYVVLEYEEKENPREACPRFVDELRKAFA